MSRLYGVDLARQSVLQGLAEVVARTAEEHGFHEQPADEDAFFGVKAMLVVTEVAKAVEAWRRGDFVAEMDQGALRKEKAAEELADAVIRILDMSELFGLDVPTALVRKMRRNEERPHLHGKRF